MNNIKLKNRKKKKNKSQFSLVIYDSRGEKGTKQMSKKEMRKKNKRKRVKMAKNEIIKNVQSVLTRACTIH